VQERLGQGSGWTRIVEVREPSGLHEIADVIHDCDFHLEGIDHDRRARTVTVPYDREVPGRAEAFATAPFVRRVRVPTFRWYLSFFGVTDCRIDDTERVGIYNFNVVTYDEARNVLTIRSNIPLTFELHVDAVHVAVDATDEVVRTRNTLALSSRWR
jgi:hypothetical protein